jgi:hypothetical protein
MEDYNKKDKVENIEQVVNESADSLAHILVALLDSIKERGVTKEDIIK